MSRIGKAPIEIPKGVEVTLKGRTVVVKGPKGTLTRSLLLGMNIKMEGEQLQVSREGETKNLRALHGLQRSLIFNMIQGVSTGFSKTLELSGVGYRASLQGKKLALSLGFSHPVEVDPPQEIAFTVAGQNKVTISGIDKELVGRVAASIRKIRKVEPYKAKGIKYQGEMVRRKAGKVAKAAAGG